MPVFTTIAKPGPKAGALLCIVLLFFTGVKAQVPDSLIFNDDFNRNMLGSAWEAPSSWTIQNGSAYLFAGSDRWLRTAASYTTPSYLLETSALGFTPGYRREFRFTFGQADAGIPAMYVVQYQPYFGGILTLGRSTDNYYYPDVLDEAILYPNPAADKWVRFRIARYASGLLQVYVDNGRGFGTTPFLEAIDSTYATLGKVAWRVDTETADEAFYVDRVRIMKPAVEKPAVREKPVPDNLVTQVSAASNRNYTVVKMANSTKVYTDRDYILTGFPAYMQGASLVQTAMDDKKANAATFLTAFIKKRAVLFAGYDPRAGTLPAWLAGWTPTGDRIYLTDPGSKYLEVYSKEVSAYQTYPYPLQLGGNLASPAAGAQMNYLLAAITIPNATKLEAEAAVFQGAVTAANHPGYSGSGFVDFQNKSSDYIEWETQVNIPGNYTLGFTYANGSSANRPLQVMLNNQPLGQLPFQPSFSWQSWAYLNGPTVYLKPGRHKIRVSAIGASGPNIDFLSVIYLNAGPANNGLMVTNAAGIPAAMLPEAGVHNRQVVAAPNPFNGFTQLTYSLPKAGRVRLTLHNSKGHTLLSMVNALQPAGTYTVPLDGSKLGAGTYFYQLRVDDKISTGKLVKQ